MTSDIQVKMDAQKTGIPKPPRKRALGHLQIFWEDSLSKNSVHSELAFLFCVDRWDASLPWLRKSICHSSSAL